MAEKMPPGRYPAGTASRRAVFSYGDTEAQQSVVPNTRRNVFLIYKEAVHNIVRHAAASRVEIEVVAESDRLRLSISDDGKGFDPVSTSDGHGLRSMRRRADEAGGFLEIDSATGDGTELRLTVELAGSRDG